MALRFEQDVGGPPGSGMFIDEEAGIRRRAYNPELAASLSAGPIGQDLARLESFQDGSEAGTVQQAAAPTPLNPVAPRGVTLAGAQAMQRAGTLPATEIPGGRPAPIASALPPAVSSDRSQAWDAAQAPPVAPVVRASGAPPPPPAAPAGTVLSKADITPGTPGYTYDKGAEEDRGEDLLERNVEMQRRDDATTALFNEQQIALNTQRQEDETRLNEEREKGGRYERELRDVVAKEINPDRVKENQGLFGSLLGLVGQTLAALSMPGSGFERMYAASEASLAKRIEQDIATQREDKSSKISLLTKQLGNAQQAESHYRASVRSLYADTLESRMKSMGVSDQYADKIQAQRDKVMADNEAARVASFGKPGTAKYQFTQPKPVVAGKDVFKPGDSESQELEKLLGPKWQENYDKGMAVKVQPGENMPNVSQAVPMIAEMDGDLSTLQALAQANGNTIPTKGFWRIPETIRAQAARLGLKDGMAAEEANQLMTGYVLRKARSYGGAVTAPDYENAEKEFGSSGNGFIRGIRRMRDAANNGVRAAIASNFRGNGQKVYDITMRSYGKTSGMASKDPEPFEVQGDKPTEKPADPEKPKRKSQRGLGRFGFMGDE